MNMPLLNLEFEEQNFMKVQALFIFQKYFSVFSPKFITFPVLIINTNQNHTKRIIIFKNTVKLVSINLFSNTSRRNN